MIARRLPPDYSTNTLFSALSTAGNSVIAAGTTVSARSEAEIGRRDHPKPTFSRVSAASGAVSMAASVRAASAFAARLATPAV
jgi:hypothetical protein